MLLFMSEVQIKYKHTNIKYYNKKYLSWLYIYNTKLIHFKCYPFWIIYANYKSINILNHTVIGTVEGQYDPSSCMPY